MESPRARSRVDVLHDYTEALTVMEEGKARAAAALRSLFRRQHAARLRAKSEDITIEQAGGPSRAVIERACAMVLQSVLANAPSRTPRAPTGVAASLTRRVDVIRRAAQRGDRFPPSELREARELIDTADGAELRLLHLNDQILLLRHCLLWGKVPPDAAVDDEAAPAYHPIGRDAHPPPRRGRLRGRARSLRGGGGVDSGGEEGDAFRLSTARRSPRSRPGRRRGSAWGSGSGSPRRRHAARSTTWDDYDDDEEAFGFGLGSTRSNTKTRAASSTRLRRASLPAVVPRLDLSRVRPVSSSGHISPRVAAAVGGGEFMGGSRFVRTPRATSARPSPRAPPQGSPRHRRRGRGAGVGPGRRLVGPGAVRAPAPKVSAEVLREMLTAR